jgi:formate dehydrogenase subunit delta
MSAVDSPAGGAATGHADHHQMVLDNLVRMLNRIGDFYVSYPDREEAIDGIASHVRKFWEPRMRRQLYAHLDGAAAGEGLGELVRAAALAHRAELEPQA